MTRPLRIVAACSACGQLGEGLTSDPPVSRKPTNLKDDWTRWAELDRLAERHTKRGHSTTVDTGEPA